MLLYIRSSPSFSSRGHKHHIRLENKSARKTPSAPPALNPEVSCKTAAVTLTLAWPKEGAGLVVDIDIDKHTPWPGHTTPASLKKGNTFERWLE